MHVFVRAVITGFGLSLGSALYKKVSKRLGLDDDKDEKPVPATQTGDQVPSSPVMTAETALAPGLLVAMPQLDDPNFKRAVVLMIEHNDEGSFGLVINQPSPIRASELLESLEMPWAGEAGAVVWSGGPVNPTTGWVLHEPVTDPDALEVGSGTTTIAPGVALSTSPERLRSLAAHPPRRIRLLLGYSGWGAGQLAAEMATGSWLHTDIDPRIIFDLDPDEMWAAAVQSIGISTSASVVPSTGVN